MTRQEIIDSITRCGNLPFNSLFELVSIANYIADDIKPVLLFKINQSGKLNRTDWKLFANSVSYVDGSPITSEIVNEWLSNECKLTYDQLVAFIQYVEFDNDWDNDVPKFMFVPTDGNLLKAQRLGDVLIGIKDKYTGEYVSLRKEVNLPSGDAISDSDIDGIIYFKVGGEYFVRYIQNSIDVRIFGAKADGNTDSTSNIQAAINSAGKIGVNEIFIPSAPSSYVIGTVNVLSNVSINSNGALILPTSVGQGFYYDNVSNITMRNLQFDGANQLTGNIYCTQVVNGCTNLKFYDCSYRNGRYGLHVENASDVLVMGCRFTAFRSWGNYFLSVDGLRLIANTAYNNTNDGFKVAGLQSPSTETTIKNVVILGNISYGNGQDGMDFAVNQIDGVTIAQNHFHDNSFYGMTFKSVYQSSSARNVLITDNVWKDNGTGGLNTQWIGAKPLNLRIARNEIYSTLNVNSGLRIQDVDSGTEVYGNIIYGYQYGIRIINSSNCKVYDNMCDLNTRNILIETQPKADGTAGVSTGVQIYRNKLKGTATPIYLQDSTGLSSPVTNVSIRDNDYSENTNTSYKVTDASGTATYSCNMNIMGYASEKPTSRGIAGDIWLNTNILTVNCIGWRAITTSGTATWDAYGITESGGRDKNFTATTSDATTTTGFASAITSGTFCTFDLDVIVKNGSNKGRYFKNYIAARNDAGVATLVSNTSIATGGDSDISGVSITVDVTGGSLRVRITGLAATSLSWKFYLRQNSL
jgi:parallel beta-helix repeat protein